MVLPISVSGRWIHGFGVCGEVEHRESGGRAKLITTGQWGDREGGQGYQCPFQGHTAMT